MPTRLLVTLQMRKSAAAGVAARDVMVASPTIASPKQRPGQGYSRDGKATRDTFSMQYMVARA
jgi:hypothetical protein